MSGYSAEELLTLSIRDLEAVETGQSCRQIEAEAFLIRSGVRREVRVSASTGLVRLGE